MIWVLAAVLFVQLITTEVLRRLWAVARDLTNVTAELAETQRVTLARLITHIENPPDVDLEVTLVVTDDEDGSAE